MSFGRAWTRELLRASGAALLAPAAVLASLVVLALGGGFGALGWLSEAFAGPTLPVFSKSASVLAPGSARHSSPLLVALAARSTVNGAANAPAARGTGAGSVGPGFSAPHSGGGSFHQGGPPRGGSGGNGGHGAHGRPPPSPPSPPGSPPPESPAPHPTPVDGVVSLGKSVTQHVPGPVGSLATQTLNQVGHTLDGILSPASGRARAAGRGVVPRLHVP